MFVRVLSFALQGVDAAPVTVEVDVSNGLPVFEVVGLPDPAVREARERVRAAVRNCGWALPAQRITVNLAPAHTRKGGGGYDLAIALGVLGAAGYFPPEALKGLAVAGEVALDGQLRPVNGALAMGQAAASEGARALLVPRGNAPEAALGGCTALGAESLTDAVAHLCATQVLEPFLPVWDGAPEVESTGPDLAAVRGQLAARRALEIAAAGGHSLFMVGPPGAGKSLLARCLPGILPPLAQAESLEVSRIYSAVGSLAHGRLIRTRPFRSPHHSASRSALLGGSSPLRPGEITLAHRGVLFLDELPEFGRDALEGLRQPLEEGRVLLARAHGALSFPAATMLVGAANPCPCGYFGDPTRACTCPSAAVSLYRSRLSGPLLDRFDLQVHMTPVRFDELSTDAGESSALVRERVLRARATQSRRFQGSGVMCNAQMTVAQTRRFCSLPPGANGLMRRAMEQLGLSLRGYDRVLRTARTIADLAGGGPIAEAHLAEALQYRAADPRS